MYRMAGVELQSDTAEAAVQELSMAVDQDRDGEITKEDRKIFNFDYICGGGQEEFVRNALQCRFIQDIFSISLDNKYMSKISNRKV